MLNTEKISELGNEISEILSKFKLRNCDLHIYTKGKDFLKIDEDLFYKLNKNSDEKEFIPSDNEIKVTFKNLTLQINKVAE